MSPLIKKILKQVASLRLTVILFSLAIILIFVGTVAQKYDGNWAVVDRYFHSLWLMMPIGIYGIKVPFVGGYSLCILMLVNLVAAHYVRFKFTWKRAGIIITHAGLILLISGELVTGLFAVEWQMPIDEGSSANYAEDVRGVELAIVDPSPQGYDNVVVVPGALLAKHAQGVPISDPLLPFEVQVLGWMTNSGIAGLGTADPQLVQRNPATDGIGRTALAMEQPRATGVDGGEVDAPSAYVRLSKHGETVGTWLVTVYAGQINSDPRQPVTVGDKTYLIELRFKRDYKPYTLHLIDFRHDKFVGTEIPRNFSSEVRMVDPSRNSDFTALIYMNHPLRHGGETFYQSGYSGETRTILQVVRNPGWLMPYIACALVSVGLIVHFGVMLWKFVSRTRR